MASPAIQQLIRQYQNRDGTLRVNELILLLTRYLEQEERIKDLEAENKILRGSELAPLNSRLRILR